MRGTTNERRRTETKANATGICSQRSVLAPVRSRPTVGSASRVAPKKDERGTTSQPLGTITMPSPGQPVNGGWKTTSISAPAANFDASGNSSALTRASTRCATIRALAESIGRQIGHVESAATHSGRPADAGLPCCVTTSAAAVLFSNRGQAYAVTSSPGFTARAPTRRPPDGTRRKSTRGVVHPLASRTATSSARSAAPAR